MSRKGNPNSDLNIYQLLMETSKKREKEKRAQLLQSVGVKEYFEDGTINIDMRTCQGVECKLCVEACPTNALYWKSGEIGIVKELCVYCAACVLSCIVDNCIQVTRKRPNGEKEKFSKPRDALTLLNDINSNKRKNMIESLFRDQEAYLKRYGK